MSDKTQDLRFGLTREQIQELAIETVKTNALHLVAALRQGDYDGINLMALLEVFASKLSERAHSGCARHGECPICKAERFLGDPRESVTL